MSPPKRKTMKFKASSLPRRVRGPVYSYEVEANMDINQHREGKPEENVAQIQTLTSMFATLNAQFNAMKDAMENKDGFATTSKPKPCTESQQSHFTFRDVEESLEKYSGEGSFEDWSRNFEESAQICSWSETEKFIYCKRLLTGAARLCCESSKSVLSYAVLKNVLRQNFQVNISTYNVYKKLETRRKLPAETFMEYAFTMKKIAAQGLVDDASLILHIINGIPDSTSNKILLYDAKNFEEFQIKLRTYENIKLANDYGKNFIFSKNDKKIDDTLKKCTNCGSKEHFKKDCPDLTKGPKCFNCNNFGHLSTNCVSMKNTISTVYSKSSYLLVKINGLEIEALVDTGSRISIITSSLSKTLKINMNYVNPGTILKGFAGSSKTSIGTTNIFMYINNRRYKINVNIVPDSWSNNDFIIGRNFIDTVAMVVDHGNVRIIETELEENDINVIDVFEVEDELSAKCSHIKNHEVRKQALNLLKDYTPRPINDVHSPIDMKINLTDETPIRQKARRLAPKERLDVNRQIEEWLRDGVIEYSTSDFSSPIVVVKKKDGTNRICVDYRKLNTRIQKDLQPMPIIEEILEKLSNAKIFTTLDLKNGFFHVSVHEDSRKYTSFVTPDGQYQFRRVPFGLTNSPGVFQRFINITLKPLILQGLVIVYMDDIVVPSYSEEENIESLERVCKLCAENGLIIKWSKCEVAKKQITFLGHIIENGSVKPSLEKTEAVKKFPCPRNIKEVQRFLGLTGYFRKFVPRYSEIARPLSDLLRADQEFVFQSTEKQSFETLKSILCEDPVLKLFDPFLETELHTDASINGLGGVLLQKHDDNNFHPVFYISFKTSPQERRMTSFELEVLAIHKCLKKLRVYLLGIDFKIVTDCQAFQQTMNKKDICSKIARWAIVINEFDCVIEHRKGVSMKHVDALSRVNPVMVVEDVFMQQIQQLQKRDKFCEAIVEILKERSYDNFVLRNDVLFKELEGKYLFVIPKSMEYNVIKQVHDRGHFCDLKVKSMIEESYFIDDLLKKIKKMSSNCVNCILINRKSGKQECFLRPIDKLDVPLHTLHMDHVGPLPSTSKNYNELLVVVDAFTKFVWIFACKTKSSSETLKKFQAITDVFGNPTRVITDKGGAFIANEFKEFCELNNIIHVQNTTGVPRGNGQVERINRTVKETLSKLTLADPKIWFKFVTPLQQILNSTVTRSTKRTPFELLFGVKMCRKDDLEVNNTLEEVIIDLFEEERNEMRKNARKEILKLQSENKKQFDKKRKPSHKYKLNDLVAIQRTQFGTGLKLCPKYLGPYQVVEVLLNDRYNVKKIGRHDGPMKTSTVADFMKPWTDYEESSGTEDEEDGRM